MRASSPPISFMKRGSRKKEEKLQKKKKFPKVTREKSLYFCAKDILNGDPKKESEKGSLHDFILSIRTTVVF